MPLLLFCAKAFLKDLIKCLKLFSGNWQPWKLRKFKRTNISCAHRSARKFAKSFQSLAYQAEFYSWQSFKNSWCYAFSKVGSFSRSIGRFFDMWPIGSSEKSTSLRLARNADNVVIYADFDCNTKYKVSSDCRQWGVQTQ